MSDSAQRLQFGEFELDESNALLTRAGAPVALPPKAFTLLCVLARQPGRLADKNALLDAVWGHRFVSESVLKSTVSQVRAALADDAGEPRYIETVSRRGYRFIGRLGEIPPIAGQTAALSTAAAPDTSRDDVEASPMMIGRADALEELLAGWQRALSGQRQLFWIAGEAGIGKSTLIDRFAAEIGSELVAHGQCVEQFGAGEPYLPIFEALKTLCRRDAAVPVLMRKAAPTWLVQMPWLVAEQDRAGLHLELAGAGQERMVRELIELSDLYSQKTPLLLITEDLHWADNATLRLMEHFARRRGPLRVMWVASFRLAQVVAEDHPLKTLRQELQLHRLSNEILLDPFSEAEVEQYVRTRVPGAAVPEESVRRLHAHTDGLPLFVANVLDGLLVPDPEGRSRVVELLETSNKPLPVPDNLTGAIEKQLTKLPSEVRGMLEAASACGMEFSARIIARLLEHDAREVTGHCDELVRRKYWLTDAGVVDLPDGSFDTRYAFRHALYKHVFYQRIPAARRVSYHRFIARAGARNEKGAGNPKPAELASHFERGHEFMAAVAQYVEAAKGALNSFAPREAIDLTGHALTLLPRCPHGPERLELELALLAYRGVASANLLGVASPESMGAFSRVREICDALPETPERALLLNGLGWGFYTRGEYSDALAMSERVHALAQRSGDPTLTAYACCLFGVTYATQGKRVLACEWLEKGLAVCEQHGDTLERPLFLLDAEVAMRANIAPALALLGRADQAREQIRKAVERSDRIRQPIARMLAHWVACIVGVVTNDVEAVDRHRMKLEEICTASSLRQGAGPVSWMRGWVEMRRGLPEIGYAHIVEGYAAHESLGMYSGLPMVLGFAAEALLMMGRLDEAELKIDESLRLVERFDERGALPLLLVVKSRIVARHGDEESRRYLDAALEELRSQQAPGAELLVRIAVAARPQCTKDDLDALAAAYERVTEGRDTPTAALARELLSRPRGEPDKPKKPRARQARPV